MKGLLAPLFCGTLFGFGLAMSGMTDVTKVIGFLDLFGNWDPSLAFVMGGGLLVTVPVFQLGIGRMKAPLFDSEFHLPGRSDLDGKLICGAALFGIGWGMVGLCPGPAIASLAYLNVEVVYFLIAMFSGMFLADFIEHMFKPDIVATETTD
ncbi:MAG: YeeE/YedE family protein [Gammaproteobacteria bacterium]|jgi:uncharacterized protein|nr:YeeE/YedE family protein [Gammaproteobacteria bacterium]MBT4493082.1 YeeE/YedE family protein [Gammaproteobacteria bacterium]MBT7369216.1 YeeE/YedE family protein [Gammaproteobacteria bacterium]